ncbi:uncharacterized protein STAUR_7724 [Stigmatella aurantiaca DW4/3-1]|uniref:Uncharacterized protein n=1 Tax=Stigmatella aurantiaca (strain DW4/3-1) TaxID=378806 RepID=Q098X3_STIAD|nr:uncharacterized protein STAUR_7724 [Stigmatella aurantiaca DW4/3-1]EAU68294.1 conserved hypothetical protein [Stigmatella aurantiaca DW4/3-1]
MRRSERSRCATWGRGWGPVPKQELVMRQQQSAPLVERIQPWALSQRAVPGSAFRWCRWTITTSSASSETWCWRRLAEDRFKRALG